MSLIKFEIQNVDVSLTDKPVWRGEEGYEKSYAFISGTANLTCEVTAEPKPKFEWLKGSKTLKSQENATIFQEEFRTILQVYLLIKQKIIFFNHQSTEDVLDYKVPVIHSNNLKSFI